MAFDTLKWLKEDLAVADDVAADLAAKLAPVADKIEKGFLRQADYSREMNGLRKAQTDLAAANDRLTNEMAEWATVQASGDKVTKKMRDDLDAAQLRVTQLQSRVTRIATDAGLDPTKALEGIDTVVTPPARTDQPPVDLSDYAKRDDLAGIVNMALSLPAELQAIADEHFDLTGKRLDTRAIVQEIRTRSTTARNQKSLDPRTIWEETHKVGELRETRDRAAHDKEISAAEARGREAAISEMSIPGQAPAGRHAPAFRTGADGHAPTSALKRPQPGSGTNSALSALRSGKYRPGVGKTA